MASEVDTQYEASDESSENELLDRSLSVWKGWNVKETFDPIPLDLHTASSIGNYDSVRSFIARKVDLNKKNRGGWTPLMYACYIGHDNIVNLLLDAGVMVNIKNHKGQTPLMLASSCGNESVGYFICQQGAELEARDNKGWTSLFHATYAGHQNMVRFLLEQGANINAVESTMGMTPFMEAAAEGHEIIVQLFLQHGVNVNGKTHSGDTARSLALIYSHMKIVSLIDNHTMPITCLRSEAGLDADLSSSDETFPVRRPSQPRGGRGKKPGPSIRDGPDAIARLINRGPSNNEKTKAGGNQTNSCVPKGYVSFKQNEGEAAEDAPRLSYRDVTSPINLQDYNTLESSGGKDSCDNELDEDGNAFSKTGALTIKSSSGSSGGLAAALGINRDSSVDSDDCQPQDSITSQSDRGSSLGGSCNSGGGLSPATSFNMDRENLSSDNLGGETSASVSTSKPAVLPSVTKSEVQTTMQQEVKGEHSTKQKAMCKQEVTDAGVPGLQPKQLVSPCGGQQEVTAIHQIVSPLPDVVNQQKPCNNKNKQNARVDFMIGQGGDYDENLHRSSSHTNTDGHHGNRQPSSSTPHIPVQGNIVHQGHMMANIQGQGHGSMMNPVHVTQNMTGHMNSGLQQGQITQNMQQGHMPPNMQVQSHMQQNLQVQGHMQQNLHNQSHMSASIQQSHLPSNMQGPVHMTSNMQGQGHMPSSKPQGQSHMPSNMQSQGHMTSGNPQGQNQMSSNIQQGQGQSHLMQQGHMLPNTSDSNYHQQQVYQSMGNTVSAQLGYQLFPSSAGMPGNPPMTSTPMGALNVTSMLQDPVFFNQAKNLEEDIEHDPKDLAGLLDQLGLQKYLPVFEEQDVDLQVFLSLTDSDLKEVGIKLFGPRKKMVNAITRWHNRGPPARHQVEQAYADRLDNEIQDLTLQVHKSYEQVETLKAQVLQEQRIRNVTESCLTDIQRISFDTRSKCEEMKESLRKLKQYHTEIKIKMQPMSMNELAGAMRDELQLDDRTWGSANENRGEPVDLVIKKIEHYIKDLQKYLSVITMNADRLLTWGTNNSHPPDGAYK